MARGARCRECRSPLYTREERYARYGTTVWYVCRNGRSPSAKRGYGPWSLKRFEPS